MIFGYGRVSTRDQNLDLQEDALQKAGCERIFTEKVSGRKKERVELARLVDLLREGDTVVVWKLDRLGRSLPDLVERMNQFRGMGVRFQCLTMAIDTETASGRFLYNVFAALAEFESDLNKERTHAGLEAARARGRVGGRPAGLGKVNSQKAEFAKLMYQNGDSNAKIMKALSIKSKETLYRWLRAKGVAVTKEEKENGVVSEKAIKLLATK